MAASKLLNTHHLLRIFMQEFAIQTENLTKIFNKGKNNEVEAVLDINLSVKSGTCVLLSGASGSGKTTLLSLLSCLTRPTAGKYHCLGQEVSHWSEKFLTEFRQKHLGIVFQHFNLIKKMTSQVNIGLPLLAQNYSLAQIEKKVQQVAQDVGIEQRLNFEIDTLSGGELQRVAIARALVGEPDIIFADEPTSHLDSENSEQILYLFSQLKAAGKTIIITSHDSLVRSHQLIDETFELKDGLAILK